MQATIHRSINIDKVFSTYGVYVFFSCCWLDFYSRKCVILSLFQQAIFVVIQFFLIARVNSGQFDSAPFERSRRRLAEQLARYGVGRRSRFWCRSGSDDGRLPLLPSSGRVPPASKDPGRAGAIPTSREHRPAGETG